MAAVALQLAAAAKPNVSARQKLRAVCEEFIGMTMFGQMLREARDSSLNNDLFHSSGERIFQSQLDDVLLRGAASGDRPSRFGRLGEALYNSLARRLNAAAAATGALDTEG